MTSLFSEDPHFAIPNQPRQVISPGNDVTLHCNLSDMGPGNTVNYQWYHNGEEAPSDGERIKASGTTLTIRNVKHDDNGVFQCRAYTDPLQQMYTSVELSVGR